MDKVRPGTKSGPPPGFLSGVFKTLTRRNLVTGTMLHFAAWLVPAGIVGVLIANLEGERHEWLMNIFNRTALHNREVARVKFSQEEAMEDQSLASVLNRDLPRPLNLSDFQTVVQRNNRKIRNQRIIAENVAFCSLFHNFPSVGVFDARYKTYNLRHKELLDVENKQESIWKQQAQVNQENNEDAVAYNKLIKLYEGYSVSDDAINSFKQRTRADLEDLQKGGPSISFNVFPNSFTALINPKPVY